MTATDRRDNNDSMEDDRDVEQANEPVIISDAILLEDDDHVPDFHVTEAVPMNDDDERESSSLSAQQPTIRLNSSHIVSVREPSQRERPEFLNVLLSNQTSYSKMLSSSTEEQSRGAVLGLTLERLEHNGGLRISHIDSSSPFVETAIAVGDILLSINNKSCQGLDPDSALAMLLSSCTSGTKGHTAICLHNVGGNNMRVATTVEKVRPNDKLGIGFRLGARGAVIVTTVDPNNILASSLLNPGDRVIYVNDNDCAALSTLPIQVTQWINEAPRFVTIVTETTSDTGVVIATGEAARTEGATYGVSNYNNRRPARQSSSSVSTPQTQNGVGKVAVVLVIAVLVIVAVVVRKNSIDNDNESFNNDDYWYIPSYPTLSPVSPLHYCQTARVIQGNGMPIRGEIMNSRLYEDQNEEALTCSTYYFHPTAWYAFFANETILMEVSTCPVENCFMDTMLTVYEGNCQSLACIDHNDDDPRCGRSTSRVTFAAVAGQTYFIAVQNFYEAYGQFGIKLEPIAWVDPCRCEGFQDLTLPPLLLSPPPTGSPLPAGSHTSPPTDWLLTTPLPLPTPTPAGSPPPAAGTLTFPPT